MKVGLHEVRAKYYIQMESSRTDQFRLRTTAKMHALWEKTAWLVGFYMVDTPRKGVFPGKGGDRNAHYERYWWGHAAGSSKECLLLNVSLGGGKERKQERKSWMGPREKINNSLWYILWQIGQEKAGVFTVWQPQSLSRQKWRCQTRGLVGRVRWFVWDSV